MFWFCISKRKLMLSHISITQSNSLLLCTQTTGPNEKEIYRRLSPSAYAGWGSDWVRLTRPLPPPPKKKKSEIWKKSEKNESKTDEFLSVTLSPQTLVLHCRIMTCLVPVDSYRHMILFYPATPNRHKYPPISGSYGVISKPALSKIAYIWLLRKWENYGFTAQWVFITPNLCNFIHNLWQMLSQMSCVIYRMRKILMSRYISQWKRWRLLYK